ncbi:MAG: hypothetical protein ABIK28_00100, partial [Planctomycetota bacterium]
NREDSIMGMGSFCPVMAYCCGSNRSTCGIAAGILLVILSMCSHASGVIQPLSDYMNERGKSWDGYRPYAELCEDVKKRKSSLGNEWVELDDSGPHASGFHART